MLNPHLLKTMLIETKTKNKNVHSGQRLRYKYLGYMLTVNKVKIYRVCCLLLIYHTNNNYSSKSQRLSLSGAGISHPKRDFHGPFSASVEEGHCGLALEGRVIKLLLNGLFA